MAILFSQTRHHCLGYAIPALYHSWPTLCVTLHWSLPLDVCNPVISHILLHSKDSCLPTCNYSSSLFTLFMEKSSTVSFFFWIARSFCWFCVFSAFLLLVGNNLIGSLIWRLQHFMPFLLLLKHLYIFYLCVFVYVHRHVCRCLWKSEEGAGSPAARVIGGCEVFHVGTRNWTSVLWKSSKQS